MIRGDCFVATTTPCNDIKDFGHRQPIIQLCIEGTRAEFEDRLEDARVLNQQAQEARTDDYEACIAAHYVARFQDPIAIDHANAVNDDRVRMN